MKVHIGCICLVACLFSGWTATPVFAQNYCSAANPNDYTPDDGALDECIRAGGMILLSAGSPGYIIAQGLRLRVNGTILSSADPGNRATLIADPSLHGLMLGAEASYYEISFLIFDGNKHNRTDPCEYPHGQNIRATGVGFLIRFIESNNARCGAGLEVSGNDYSIYNSTFAWNGFSEDERSGEFADGMSVHRCNGASITNNQFAENTDIGLVVREGIGCTIRWNTFWNYSQRAFAGMHVSAGADGGYHTGSDYSNNTIESGYDRMGFGLIVGAETWHGTRTADVGSITWNSISGAVINLAVDGVDGGTIANNSMWNAQGTRGYGTCAGQQAADFTAAHNGPGLNLQGGWVFRSCH